MLLNFWTTYKFYRQKLYFDTSILMLIHTWATNDEDEQTQKPWTDW